MNLRLKMVDGNYCKRSPVLIVLVNSSRYRTELQPKSASVKKRKVS